jgi:hypothetical protein
MYNGYMDKEKDMIETVLFGKKCQVRPEWLKLFKRKEALVEEALAIKKLGSSMSAQEHLELTSRAVGKIITQNRKIAKLGAHVVYSY